MQRATVGKAFIGAVILAAGTSTTGFTELAAASVPTSCLQPAQGTTNDANLDQDLNNDAKPDLVLGVPRASVGAAAGAGAVDIHYSTGQFGGGGVRATQRITVSSLSGMPAPAAGDAFGSATAFAELDAGDRDGCHDLVIGAPGSDGGTGAVYIAFGSLTGISSTGALRLTGQTTAERFGAAVAVVGDDIWIGAPDRTVAGRLGAGAIDHYRITGKNTVARLETITEDSPGVPGVAEAGDHFGSVLHGELDNAPVYGVFDYSWPSDAADHLVIGEPYENVGSAVDAGSVTVLAFDPITHRVAGGRTVTQNTPGVPGVAEAGDHFGASVWTWEGYLAVGVPGEDVGSLSNAGMLQVFNNARTSAPLTSYGAWTQNSPGVPGNAEAGDEFGAAVVVSFFFENGQLEVAVGSPGESIGSVKGAGTVTFVLLPAHPSSTGFPQLWYQGPGALGGVPEAGDHVGASLSLFAQPFSDFDVFYPEDTGDATLVIGVPGEDIGTQVDAGGVTTLWSSSIATYHDSAGAIAHEQYGSVGPTSHNT